VLGEPVAGEDPETDEQTQAQHRGDTGCERPGGAGVLGTGGEGGHGHSWGGRGSGSPPRSPPGVNGDHDAVRSSVRDVAALGWNIARRCAACPSRVMSWLVPLVIVVSLVPDVLIAVSSGPVAGIALGLMHLAVLAVALPTFRHFLPLPR
jgi:hypothetical protein